MARGGVGAARVEHDAMAEGIEVHVDQLGELRLEREAALGIEQLAQTRVLFLHRAEPREARLREQQLLPEHRVLVRELAAVAHDRMRAAHDAHRRRDQPVDGTGDVAGRATHRGEVLTAMVHHHQHDRGRQLRESGGQLHAGADHPHR